MLLASQELNHGGNCCLQGSKHKLVREAHTDDEDQNASYHFLLMISLELIASRSLDLNLVVRVKGQLFLLSFKYVPFHDPDARLMISFCVCVERRCQTCQKHT